MTGLEAHKILMDASLKSKSVGVAHALRSLADHLGMDAFAPHPRDAAAIALRTAELLDHPESLQVK